MEKTPQQHPKNCGPHFPQLRMSKKLNGHVGFFVGKAQLSYASQTGANASIPTSDVLYLRLRLCLYNDSPPHPVSASQCYRNTDLLRDAMSPVKKRRRERDDEAAQTQPV
ncbi:hypothetical protein P4O66_001214 [Electrophorus voltai]|uniref:Uncharacterized protein n=1 Tax=Electrophorus voltai TaxID=2609070 RepID=A0AAD8ZCV8_9TELE|nr:hypothetical protein P4O66_001214 [Electrophorus voltai]